MFTPDSRATSLIVTGMIAANASKYELDRASVSNNAHNRVVFVRCRGARTNLRLYYREVKDQSGAVAPDAAVTATNSKTNVARSTATNAAGIYSFPDLTPGTYEVKVAATGFANIVKTN